MLEAVSLKTLLSHRPYGGYRWDTRRHWQRETIVGLLLLCEAHVPIEKAADALARSPSSIAWRARDTGLRIPPDWRDVISKPRKSDRAPVQLQYPYIAQVRGEHADLLAVNALVPHGLPDHMRADVCQEIMLALWQKEISVEELRRDKSLVRKFIGGFRKANLEGGGYALSLDMPMRDGRSWYDVLPDPTTLSMQAVSSALPSPRCVEEPAASLTGLPNSGSGSAAGEGVSDA
jgi:hypothetical protein